jgi:hypothetical protein
MLDQNGQFKDLCNMVRRLHRPQKRRAKDTLDPLIPQTRPCFECLLHTLLGQMGIVTVSPSPGRVYKIDPVAVAARPDGLLHQSPRSSLFCQLRPLPS